MLDERAGHTVMINAAIRETKAKEYFIPIASPTAPNRMGEIAPDAKRIV